MDLALRMAGGLRDHFRGFQLMSACRSRIASLLAILCALQCFALFVPVAKAEGRCVPGAACDQGEAYNDCMSYAASAGDGLCKQYGSQFVGGSPMCMLTQAAGGSVPIPARTIVVLSTVVRHPPYRQEPTTSGKV